MIEWVGSFMAMQLAKPIKPASLKNKTWVHAI